MVLENNLSYRDLQEMMLERGIEVSHTVVLQKKCKNNWRYINSFIDSFYATPNITLINVTSSSIVLVFP